MGYLGTLLAALSVLSAVFAEEGCPPASAISPCTCDGEGVSCMRATSIDQIKKAFRANYPEGGGLYVYIQGTPITSIPSDLFGSYKTQNFYIEMNKISTIDMKCFDHTSKYIRSISFFGNELTNFDYSYISIQKLPLMWNLNLGKNKIKTIPTNAFNHKGIGSIILTGNLIDSIGPNAFLNCPNLRKLDLSSNQLATLGPYSMALQNSAPGLQINLMSNLISTISVTAFHNASPQVLFLGYNRLGQLKQDVFSPLIVSMSRHGGVIEASGNPFTCKGCEDYGWIVDNQRVLHQLIIGFVCPDRATGIIGLTRRYVGC